MLTAGGTGGLKVHLEMRAEVDMIFHLNSFKPEIWSAVKLKEILSFGKFRK